MSTSNRMKLNPYLTSFSKINSKWTEYINLRTKTIKFLEENIEVMLYDMRLGNNFLDKTPKA